MTSIKIEWIWTFSSFSCAYKGSSQGIQTLIPYACGKESNQSLWLSLSYPWDPIIWWYIESCTLHWHYQHRIFCFCLSLLKHEIKTLSCNALLIHNTAKSDSTLSLTLQRKCTNNKNCRNISSKLTKTKKNTKNMRQIMQPNVFV